MLVYFLSSAHNFSLLSAYNLNNVVAIDGITDVHLSVFRDEIRLD
jgi:hypothetical protein